MKDELARAIAAMPGGTLIPCDAEGLEDLAGDQVLVAGRTLVFVSFSIKGGPEREYWKVKWMPAPITTTDDEGGGG